MNVWERFTETDYWASAVQCVGQRESKGFINTGQASDDVEIIGFAEHTKLFKRRQNRKNRKTKTI